MLSMRRADSADVEALTALRVALLRELGKVKDVEEEQRLYALTRAYLSAALPAGKLLAWVAEADRQIVASGLAGAILRQMIDYTQRETGARRLWLRATAAGRPLYERAGFVTTTREMELVW